MGVIESIGRVRDKFATKDFNQIEACLPLCGVVLDEVLRVIKRIMKEGSYNELKFNSYDLSETAKEIQEYVIKIQRNITVDKLSKKNLGIDKTVDFWNKQTDFINQAILISQKLSLLGYLMKIIEDNTVENTLEYTVIETLKGFLK